MMNESIKINGVPPIFTFIEARQRAFDEVPIG
ncbi:hypothetical protein CLV99_0449 [Sphingobacterium yanglingense]|uniref:Uncharacterized protein n=1 Tax=Sphingobacterium yanglingense TaxID=1437280 RepID=A0A4R6WRH6_9SPHI|nr:hypothetical protein CLV99_0449 [Sphingobacterium yanglingense]